MKLFYNFTHHHLITHTKPEWLETIYKENINNWKSYTFFKSGRIALNSFPLRKFTEVSFCKISLKILLLRLLLGSLLFAVDCDAWLFFIACNLTTDQLMICQQLCNWPIGYSVSGLTEVLLLRKSHQSVFSRLVSIVIITSWFAIALDEIRTRRILREKTDCKAVYRPLFSPSKFFKGRF